MLKYKQIKVNNKYVEAICVKLQSKNFVLLRGLKGYIMCGYLNMSLAARVNDVAVKITGVSSIEEALKAKAFSVSPAAGKLGIYKGKPVKEILPIIS